MQKRLHVKQKICGKDKIRKTQNESKMHKIRQTIIILLKSSKRKSKIKSDKKKNEEKEIPNKNRQKSYTRSNRKYFPGNKVSSKRKDKLKVTRKKRRKRNTRQNR